jgi:hypothetical protein
VSSVVLGPGIIIEHFGNLVRQPGLPLPPKNISTVLSSYMSAQARKHTRTTYVESQMAAGIFFLTDYVALNFFAGGDDGCSHIMDAPLILLVA